MGLLDLFGGGYSTDPNAVGRSGGGGVLGGGNGGAADLYGGLLDTPQKQAVARAFWPGFAKAIAPYLGYSLDPGQVGSFAQVLNAGVGGGQDARFEAGRSGMTAQKIKRDDENAKSEIAIKQQKLALEQAAQAQAQQEFNNLLSAIGLGGDAPATAASLPGAGGTPGPQTQAGNVSARQLVSQNESSGNPYVGYGGADLSNAPLDDSGFPQWAGKMGPKGISHAAGLYQFQPGTWRQYAVPLGIKDFSPESQHRVFDAAHAAEGFGPWAPYNTKIAAALQGGVMGAGQTQRPVQLASAGPIGQGVLGGGGGGGGAPAPAGGLLAPGGVQVAQAAPSAPAPAAAAPGGGLAIDPQTRRILGLHMLGARAGIPGLGGILSGSPDYQAAQERAKEAAKYPFASGLQTQGKDLDLRNAQQTPTGEMKDYEAYRKDQQMRGQQPISFFEWDTGRRKSGATMINTAEGMDAAQTRARIAIDTKAAEEIGTQAMAARRTLPLLDEVIRLAPLTPGGWGGPLAAQTAKAFSAAGIPVPEGASNAEVLQSISQRLIPIVREPGATAASEMDAYLRAVPGLMQSQEGRVKVAEMTKRMANRAIDIAKVYRSNVGSPDLFDKLAALDKPLFTEDQRAALQTAGGAASGTGAAAPPLAPGESRTYGGGTLRRNN